MVPSGTLDFPVGSNQLPCNGTFNGERKSRPGGDEFSRQYSERAIGQGGRHVNAAVNLSVGHGPISVAVAGPHWESKLDLVVVIDGQQCQCSAWQWRRPFNPQVAYPTEWGESLCRS